MATVREVKEYLSKLSDDTPLIAVVLTREEFNYDIIQGNSNPIPSDESFAEFAENWFDGANQSFGSQFIDWQGDTLYEAWTEFEVESF